MTVLIWHFTPLEFHFFIFNQVKKKIVFSYFRRIIPGMLNRRRMWGPFVCCITLPPLHSNLVKNKLAKFWRFWWFHNFFWKSFGQYCVLDLVLPPHFDFRRESDIFSRQLLQNLLVMSLRWLVGQSVKQFITKVPAVRHTFTFECQ